MRKITLTPEERETLSQAWLHHPKSHVRHRCKSLLLSDSGHAVKKIASMFEVRTRTIYTWMDRWQDIGYTGLTILPGRGLKSALSLTDKKVVDIVKKKR